MPNDTLYFKEEVERYKELLKRKEELEKEYNNWTEMHYDVKELIKELRVRYEKEQTEEAKAELDSWLEQEKDYIYLIDEKMDELNEVLDSLEIFDSELLDKQAECMANEIRFKEISDMLKEIEKRSLKMAGKGRNSDKIGTNLVEIENAEGRKKKINESLSLEYLKLTEEKRTLAKLIRKQREELKKLSSKHEQQVKQDVVTVFNALMVKKSEETPIVEAKTPVEVKEEISLPEGLIKDYKLNRQLLSTLPYEEQIKILEEYQESLKTAPGKGQKVRFKYNGEYVYMHECYKGSFIACGGDIASLKKKILDRDAKELAPKLVEMYHENDNEIWKINNDLNGASEADKFSEEDLRHFSEAIAIVNGPAGMNHEEQTEQNLKSVQELFVQNEETPKTSEEEKIEDVYSHSYSYIKDYEDIYSDSHLVVPEGEDNYTKPTIFSRIVKKEKPKNKEKLSEKTKKIAAIIAAGVIVLGVAAVGIGMAVKGLFNKNKPNSEDLNDIPSYSDTLDQGTEEAPEDTPIIREEENSFSMGDKFAIHEGAFIYQNMYDASKGENQFRPYFGYETERTVGGVVIKTGDRLDIIYHTDPNAQEKINVLLANGGEIDVLLAVNERGYEGYFNVKDVKELNQSLGGSSR